MARNARSKIILGDFTRLRPPTDDNKRATLLICNPPYVRNQHIEPTEKQRLQRAIQDALGIKLSGLSGLYCYFMALAHDSGYATAESGDGSYPANSWSPTMVVR